MKSSELGVFRQLQADLSDMGLNNQDSSGTWYLFWIQAVGKSYLISLQYYMTSKSGSWKKKVIAVQEYFICIRECALLWYCERHCLHILAY